ncbi:MAG: aspartyl/asparaginyl beta-hydroxylase domain-containing protein [Pseudomonadota bacterium]
MTKKQVKKLFKVVVPTVLLLYFVPWLVVFYTVCGLIDVSRHRRWEWVLLEKYFFGNGILTWLLAPLNLVFDLFSLRHPYRLQLDDFPDQQRAEIQRVLDVFNAKRDAIVDDLRVKMAGRQRGMQFYKWYGKNTDDFIPEFNQEFKFVKTIGVSVFNSHERTRLHFGPLRATVRLLYNLTPRQSEKIFIEVNNEKHYWHDDPLFIFDDTIQHRSINDEDGERFCVFVDVLRPTWAPGILSSMLTALQVLLKGFNHVFYKNWDMLGGQKAQKA